MAYTSDSVAGKWGTRGQSCPKSQVSSCDGPGRVLGFTQERFQERHIAEWKQVYLEIYIPPGRMQAILGGEEWPPGGPGWLVFMGWVISGAVKWRDTGFPRTESLLPFGLLWLASELSWHLWMRHPVYANILQWVYNEAQVQLESRILLPSWA